MKLASLKQGRDGRLMVVSRDLVRSADASAVAPTLQAALDDWNAAAPRLQEIADALEADRMAHLPFDPAKCASPLPRAFGWVVGAAYLNHIEVVRRGRGMELPASFRTDPLTCQGRSDAFSGPHDPIRVSDEAWGVDFGAGLAAIVTDVPQGAAPAETSDAIRLLMLAQDTSLRNLVPSEAAEGFGFLQSNAQTAFSPVAVTPDELGSAFDGAKVNLPLLIRVNGVLFGCPNAGADMTFDFPALIAHAARTRPIAAGVIVGSGPISNADADGGPGKPVAEGGVGYACIAELRAVETIRAGAPKTPFLRVGDRLRVEMHDAEGRSVFGAIEQDVVPLKPMR